MKMHLFANRVHRTFFSGGSVVIEFCVIPPDENGEVMADTPVTDDDVHFAVSLPLNGYLRSVGQLRKYAEELQQKGIVKKPEESQGGQKGNAGGGQQARAQGDRNAQQNSMRGGQDPQGRQAEQRRRVEKQKSLEDLTDQPGEEPLV